MAYFKENRGFKMKGFSPYTKKTDPPQKKDPTWMGTDEYRDPKDIPASEYKERGLNPADYIPGYKEKKPVPIPKKKKKETKEDRLTKSIKLQKSENPDTWTPKGKTSKRDLIDDLEQRIEFLTEDVKLERKTKKEVAPAIRKLRKRLGYLRQNK